MITVALVHYESPELAAACVASVRRFPPTEPYEVIVVDNGSAPELRAPLDGLEGVLLVDTGRNGGFAFGVNRCFAAADRRSDVLILMNPDTEVANGRALDLLIEHARLPGTALAAPLLSNATGKRERSFHRRFPSLMFAPILLSAPIGVIVDRVARLTGRHPFELSLAQLEHGSEIAHVMGAVMAIPRVAWTAVGPFDESYFLYLEETDWQARAMRRGLRVRYAAGAEVMHLHRGGALEGAVPSSAYLDSLLTYLSRSGTPDALYRSIALGSLATSIVTFGVLRVGSLFGLGREAFAQAGLASSIHAFRHLLRRQPSVG